MNDLEELLNLVRREIERSLLRIARPRAGTVTSYDPARHAVQVQWPEEVAEDGSVQQSPWIPIKVTSLGSGWGMAHGPAIGSQALVDFLDGNPGTPFVSGFLPSLAEVPPSAASGETWLVHSTGSTIKLTNDGGALMLADTEAIVSGQTVDIAGGQIILTGSISADGASLLAPNLPTPTPATPWQLYYDPGDGNRVKIVPP